ncbi:7-cyano-7-deazaguanine synthase QueC [Solwaraspora sp. WMMD791]|uniref:7-cyano-7-deazaguanine synthase QueC n=1 Tax=Solwaraspora sp. WMMD791 TaxID=3016086 RepID=UPI00249A45AA|nr:7-cyano-7-deazaguanine synthase QueC [Solwaraspora sp. WMMD791]WFE27684.1 7-cyano-7-deazaguanine synthase QueC [Solwaraspora sp. WMMD791]
MRNGPSGANAGSPRKVVLVLSGGLDSTVLAHRLRAEGCDLTMLSFNYGQSHRRELEFAYRTAASLGGAHRIVQLGAIAELLAGSSLTDPAVAMPDGHYSDSSMRATVVSNRNAIMLDVAVAHAVAIGANAVAFGAHAGDHPIYPDCRPSFVAAYEQMVRVANEGFIDSDFVVLAPFINASKSQIVAEGARLGVPFEDTWSCYRGGARHCGRCGTCVERREAFFVANVADPTEYEVP